MLIDPQRPCLVLAPMEGVTDAPMRALLGEVGAFDYGVSEFIRVSQEVPPARVFYKHIPELRTGSKTLSQMPVQVQLLGGNPERMALAASLVSNLGAPGIDINFGCPAPTVNRHDGGATLLKFPNRIRDIVEAVRAAVPKFVPVSAKLRLGWDEMRAIYENAERAAEGGASWITIHGRTKEQGYRPPAYWKPIGEVRKRLGIPVVANGEIWTVDDFERCREETGCLHFMLGRGALADPLLAVKIKARLNVETSEAKLSVGHWRRLIERFLFWSEKFPKPSTQYALRRIKQWLKYAHMRNEILWFDSIKRAASLEEFLRAMPTED